jgi:membrane protein YdbS with pleckstrin-like domain
MRIEQTAPSNSPHKKEKQMLITIIVVLLVVGVALYLINNYVPMDPKIKQILNVVVVILVVLWLLFTVLPLFTHHSLP